MTSATLFTLLLLTFLTISLVTADDGDAPPDFAGMGGGKPCPGFRCSSGQSPVQKSRSKFTSTGCSKMGGGMMMMGGAFGQGGEKYAVCCDRWHACYQTCGAPKQVCDDSFKSCSADVCLGDDDCKKNADMNSMMLGLGGCGLYDRGQYDACECVPKEKREEKRKSALRSFYKKYAPDSLDKVDGLAKKADTTVKLSALFRKLHKKYPESIKVKVDESMARMQEMMKNAEDKVKKDDVVEEEEEEETIVGEREEL